MSDDLRETRLAELLCDRAIHGLALEEQSELDELQSLFGTGDDPSLELAAAELHRAVLEAYPGEASMPSELADSIVERFSPDMLERGESRPSRPEARILPLPVEGSTKVSTLQGQTLESDVVPEREPESRSAWSAAWPLAAAACIAFVLGGLAGVNSPRPQAKRLAASGMGANVEVPRPDLAAQRRAMLAEAKDVVRIEWKASKDSAANGAGGDVVWSPSQQRGFMRFSGLQRNDANQTRYQLWIFDQKRDDRYPVDGGVFDIDAGTGDIIIPIEAKLPVLDPSLFAVTVEGPNGVVVSNRERIVLTAAVDG